VDTATLRPPPSLEPSTRRAWRLPLGVRVVIGVVFGAALGVVFGTRPWWFGHGNEDLGALGLLVIRLLKALATPLILFAVLDSFLTTTLSGRTFARFVTICLVNIAVAMTIGLTILNAFHPGLAWRGHIEGLTGHAVAPAPTQPPAGATLDLLKNIAGYVPESVVDPLAKNSIISLVLLAILCGAALRKLKDRGSPGIAFIQPVVTTLFELLTTMLLWVAEIVPFAVLGIVAQVVGRAGLDVFRSLWLFLVVILAGLLVHSLVYYPLAAWFVGRKPPRVYLGKGSDAVLTGLSTNSSLATVPVTLRCLRDLNVGAASARVSACIGTNLNNDGIILYEAMATVFLCQAFGYELSFAHQLTIVLASVMAGVGIAGVPEAGLIVLPLVLGAAGLPEAAVAAAIPLIVPVDWIIARVRSGVNVLADMLVAILLDRFERNAPAAVRAVEPIVEP
jgi:DAACS family dicarboxylate/amino acid:cation (Na+ or H+) symporter